MTVLLRLLLVTAAALGCAAAVLAPFKITGSDLPGNVLHELLLDLAGAGDPGGLTLASLLGLGMATPVLAALVAPLGPSTALRGALLRVVGLASALTALALGAAMTFALTRFSFGGGAWEHTPAAYGIPAFYGVVALVAFAASARSGRA